MRAASLLAILIVGTGFAATPPAGAADVADPDAGRTYADMHCSGCHNVNSRDPEVPRSIGPSFAAVAAEKTTTATGLSVFLQTPHASMPNLIIPVEDRRNIIAYILSLKPGARGNGT